jgi:hypothetical protein
MLAFSIALLAQTVAPAAAAPVARPDSAPSVTTAEAAKGATEGAPAGSAETKPAAPRGSQPSAASQPTQPEQPKQPRPQPRQPTQPLQPWQEDERRRAGIRDDDDDDPEGDQSVGGARRAGSSRGRTRTSRDVRRDFFAEGAASFRGGGRGGLFALGRSGLSGPAAAGGTGRTGEAFVAALRVDAFGGLNDNVYQTPDPLNPRIIRRHPAAFYGGEALAEFVSFGKNENTHSLRLGARGQEYYSLDGAPQTPDGTANAAWGSRVAIDGVTIAAVDVFGGVQQFNAARITDLPIPGALDQTTVNRTFATGGASLSVARMIRPQWTYVQTVNAQYVHILRQPPIARPDGSGAITVTGPEFFQAGVTGEAAYDMTARTRYLFNLAYAYTRTLFLPDLNTDPPRNLGPDSLHQVIPTVGHNYLWSPTWSTELRAGITANSPSTLVPGGLWVLSPTFTAEATYNSETLQFTAGAAYINAPVVPRLGAGPNYAATTSLGGTPFPKAWRGFSVLALGSANYGLSSAGPVRNEFTTFTGGVQARIALGRLFGFITGWEGRYTSLGLGPSVPPFYRNVVYAGLSMSLSTDRTRPVLTSFAAAQ